MRRTFPAILLAALLLALSGPASWSLAAGRIPDRAIVLPFQPAPGTAADGAGPALQNLIENMLALHPDLEETYLLRHLHEAFPNAWELKEYLAGRRPHPAPIAGLAREGARYILSGFVLPGGKAEVRLLDLATGTAANAVLPVDPAAGLVGFRRSLMDLLAVQAGLVFPPAQAAKALRPDTTTAAALKAYGLSYGAYLADSYLRDKGRVSLPLARQAAEAAPLSYLARNMLGWQLFASGDLARAETAFREALARDPDGVDALDGMMQCAFRLGGLEAAQPWALRKAKARGAGIGQPLAELHLLAGRLAVSSKKARAALGHFRLAAALDPNAELPATQLAMALEATAQYGTAFAPVEGLLEKAVLPSVKARLLNFQARLSRWISRAHRQGGRPLDEKKSLERALEFLKQSPVPDLHEYSLILRRLAVIAVETGDPLGGVKILEMIRPEKNTDPLFLETVRTYALARANRMDQASATARKCLTLLAERARAHDPVAPTAYEYLGKGLEIMGEAELARAMERQMARLGATKSL